MSNVAGPLFGGLGHAREPEFMVGKVRLFGFKRAGQKIVGSFRRVLDGLVEDRVLVLERELLQLPDAQSE